jgi:hypothetical protein
MQVTQKEITTHKEMGVPLNAYMLHNLAHVELNAIDLAWDTVVRFAPLRDTLGDGFFADFARVADDESRHFRWYSQRLAELGFRLVAQKMQHQLLASSIPLYECLYYHVFICHLVRRGNQLSTDNTVGLYHYNTSNTTVNMSDKYDERLHFLNEQ